MADVKLLKYDGTEQQYRGVERVQLAKIDGGTAIFSEGEAIEGIEISPDFSFGDMPVIAPTGTLVKSAYIMKPDTLKPENIRKGVRVAGIEGDLIGDTEELTVELSMSDGDQIILPTEDGKVISKAVVRKPDTLVPENILKGVEIGGITGELEFPESVETEVNLDFSNGPMEVTPEAGTVFGKVNIPVPENLIPENIVKGVTIAGIKGESEGGGSNFDDKDENLKYFVYKVDNEARKVILYGILYSQIYEDTGKYDVTIPDLMGGYSVVIAAKGVI